MRDSVHTLVFAAVLAVVCALLLTAAGRFTRPYRIANEKAEEIRNFLDAFEVPVKKDAAAKELVDIFNKNIRVRQQGDFSLYEYVPAGSVASAPEAVAVPFSGAGLWGPIKGVLALEPDLQTIRGIRFYQQEETPGLGGEIGAEWFQAQFKDKRIVSDQGKPGFRIVNPGSPTDRNSVDGITGATMTSDRVAVILDALAKALSAERPDHGE